MKIPEKIRALWQRGKTQVQLEQEIKGMGVALCNYLGRRFVSMGFALVLFDLRHPRIINYISNVPKEQITERLEALLTELKNGRGIDYDISSTGMDKPTIH